MEKFWTFERNGEIFDGEFPSEQAAQDHANEIFAEECQENSPSNNEEFHDDITAIEFYYDDDAERKILNKISGCVIYTHYHGDLTEHGAF